MRPRCGGSRQRSRYWRGQRVSRRMRAQWRFASMAAKRQAIPKGAPRPRRAVLDMAPYSPPTSDRLGKLRLDFNENTVGCSPRIIDFLQQRLSADRLAVYPDYSTARPALAEFFHIGADQL